MKRLCIYVIYDHENIVDDYIGYMLQKLRKVVDYLVVVCNFRHIIRGGDNIRLFADELYYRENTGFDAGAYKDVLCRYLGWDVVRGYDELLLANDSFYGPVYPFENLFDRMDKTRVDYWGLTRCPKGKLASGYSYKSHIQSYFFAIRKKVLSDDNFKALWESMEQPQSYVHAIIVYELGLNQFMQENGYEGAAVMELFSLLVKAKENENPYMTCALELIRDVGIPVIKRKSFNLTNPGFDNALEALKFIERECDYDTGMIVRHLSRLGKGLSLMSLDEFYAAHPRIYIYGAGLYGKRLEKYFAYKGWRFEKFLVTDSETPSEHCISFDKADIAENDGIIIAVGSEKAFREILNSIQKRCNREQIFNPDGIIR